MSAIASTADIAGVLSKALDLPDHCVAVTLRLRVHKPPTVSCVYYPPAFPIDAKGKLMTVCRRYKLEPLEWPGIVDRRAEEIRKEVSLMAKLARLEINTKLARPKTVGFSIRMPA